MMRLNPLPNHLNTRQLADATGYEVGTIRVYINKRLIPATKWMDRWFIHVSEVEPLRQRRARTQITD
jgi:hypothetical protein